MAFKGVMTDLEVEDMNASEIAHRMDNMRSCHEELVLLIRYHPDRAQQIIQNGHMSDDVADTFEVGAAYQHTRQLEEQARQQDACLLLTRKAA